MKKTYPVITPDALSVPLPAPDESTNSCLQENRGVTRFSGIIEPQRGEIGKSPEKPVELIEKLLKSPGLRGWERLFIRTVKDCRKPGRKQLDKVRAIATRLGMTEGGCDD